MILNITGPASTGKTTLVNDLKSYTEELKKIFNVEEVKVLHETARGIFDRYFSNKYSTLEELLGNSRDAIEYHRYITINQLQTMSKYSNMPDTLLICDRCELDTMVYLSLNYHNIQDESLREELEVLYREMLRQLHESFLQSNNITFRTLPFKDVEHDGFRPGLYDVLRQSECLGFDMITESVSILLPSGREERVNFILEKCRDFVGGDL